jgi:glycosyltransferase involved in cell wall biosynthesis
LNEAGKVLEADVLLTTLPKETKFSASETTTVDEIRGGADDERQLSARAKVDRYDSDREKRHIIDPTHTDSGSPTLSKSEAYYIEKVQADGVDAVVREILRAYADKKTIGANECIHVAKALRNAGLPEAEYPLMVAAKALHTSPATLRSFYWAAQREKRFEEACDAIKDIETRFGASLSPAESQKLDRLKDSPAYQLTLRNLIGHRRPRFMKPVEGRICYVLHNSLPYSSGGYATRSHGVSSGLNKVGFEVIALTRPGFPSDTKPEVAPETVPLNDVIDGVQYARIPLPLRKSIACPSGRKIFEYVPEAADELERKLRELNPQIVIAASNYFTSLPALIAARRLGIPFVYEVRGLWEITRLSRDAGFENTATFVIQSMFEATVCNEADHVYTLTGPMREELIARGVDASKIDLLPNSCDPDRFLPRARDVSLANQLSIPDRVPVIGYVGTFVDYEGLEDLASACALLKQQGIEFRLLLVGNENASGQDRGPITEQITVIANSYGFLDWLIMPGRVPHEEVESYYSLIDIAPFPRKPWPVCEMVSPMKPLEAFAMEKAVVVSSVRALQEMVKHEETGLVFEKGNVKSLADVLERLVADPALRRTLGKNARKWVQKERTWAASTEILASYVRGLSQAPSPIVVKTMPVWWQTVPSEFRDRCHFRDITEWNLSNVAKDLKSEYESRFGKDSVAKKIPFSNWQRADICSQLIASDSPTSVLDIGSGLGEFVNIFSSTNPTVPIASVDVKDYALWFDRTERVERIYKSIFDLGSDEVRDVVTCFEVIEHLPPERLDEAIRTLRSLAKRKLFVSVPFMEPLPLSKGHHSRFEDSDLLKLFPDAKFTIFSKGGKSPNKVLAWIMCEIDCETE